MPLNPSFSICVFLIVHNTRKTCSRYYTHFCCTLLMSLPLRFLVVLFLCIYIVHILIKMCTTYITQLASAFLKALFPLQMMRFSSLKVRSFLKIPFHSGHPSFQYLLTPALPSVFRPMREGHPLSSQHF